MQVAPSFSILFVVILRAGLATGPSPQAHRYRAGVFQILVTQFFGVQFQFHGPGPVFRSKVH